MRRRRLENHIEAADFVNCAWAGGSYAAIGLAAVNVHGSRPEFCNFTNSYFDNSDNGADFQYCCSFTFTSQWASSRNGSGITLRSCTNATLQGGKLINSWAHGLKVEALCFALLVKGNQIAGNNRSGAMSGDGVNIAAGLTDFVIQGNRIGGSATLGSSLERWGVFLAVGAPDRYVIDDNLVSGNTAGGVSDGGTGINKRVAANF